MVTITCDSCGKEKAQDEKRLKETWIMGRTCRWRPSRRCSVQSASSIAGTTGACSSTAPSSCARRSARKTHPRKTRGGLEALQHSKHVQHLLRLGALPEICIHPRP